MCVKRFYVPSVQLCCRIRCFRATDAVFTGIQTLSTNVVGVVPTARLQVLKIRDTLEKNRILKKAHKWDPQVHVNTRRLQQVRLTNTAVHAHTHASQQHSSAERAVAATGLMVLTCLSPRL